MPLKGKILRNCKHLKVCQSLALCLLSFHYFQRIVGQLLHQIYLVWCFSINDAVIGLCHRAQLYILCWTDSLLFVRKAPLSIILTF